MWRNNVSARRLHQERYWRHDLRQHASTGTSRQTEALQGETILRCCRFWRRTRPLLEAHGLYQARSTFQTQCGDQQPCSAPLPLCIASRRNSRQSGGLKASLELLRSNLQAEDLSLPQQGQQLTGDVLNAHFALRQQQSRPVHDLEQLPRLCFDANVVAAYLPIGTASPL